LTIKYLAGNRVQGTHKDRITSTRSINDGCTLNTSNYVINGSSVVFDGTNDRLMFGNTSDWNFLHNGGSWTVAFWLIPDNYNTDDMLFNTNGTTNTNVGVQCTGLSAGNIRIRISDGKTGDLVTLTGTNYYESTYNFIVITYNGSTLSMQRSDYSGSLSTAITSNNIAGKTFCQENSLNPLTIGTASDAATTSPYDGMINSFTIWDRVLSSAEITTLHGSGTGSNFNPSTTFTRRGLKLQTCWRDSLENKIDAWHQNVAVSFEPGTVFEETDTGKSYIVDEHPTTTKTYNHIADTQNNWFDFIGSYDFGIIKLLSGSPAIGTRIRKVKVDLSKTGSPPGTAYVRVWDENNKIVTQRQFEPNILLTTSQATYEFILPKDVELKENYKVGIEYPTSAASNYMRQYMDTSGAVETGYNVGSTGLDQGITNRDLLMTFDSTPNTASHLSWTQVG